MAQDFATESTLRRLSPFFVPLATESAIIVLQGKVDSAVAVLVDIANELGASTNQTPVNEFDEHATVPVSSETVILSYTVPVSKTLKISGWSGWGDGSAEYIMKIDGVQEAGARTSTANPTHDTFFLREIPATTGQVVTIRALRSDGSTTISMKANLRGILSNG